MSESVLKIPKQELKKLIQAQFNFDRRRFLFWSFNTTYFGIALFQMYSDINIEGGNNISLCYQSEMVKSEINCSSYIFNCLVALVIAHLA